MLIRPASPSDLPAMVAMWREMWDLHERADPRWASTPAAERVIAVWIEEHLRADRSRVLVAQEGLAVVGYALGMILENPPVGPHPQFGYVSELSVGAAHRRSGAGRLLLDGLHAWFRAQGVTYAEVNVSVVNDAARAFYRRLGYREFLERLRVEL